jgi:hypothetical protein
MGSLVPFHNMERFGNGAKVSFTHHKIPVAPVPEEIGKNGNIGTAVNAVLYAAMYGSMIPGQKGTTGGHADGRGCMGLSKQDTFTGQSVRMGGDGLGIPHAFESVAALSVSGDQ